MILIFSWVVNYSAGNGPFGLVFDNENEHVPLSGGAGGGMLMLRRRRG